jgi:hypothetical protein
VARETPPRSDRILQVMVWESPSPVDRLRCGLHRKIAHSQTADLHSRRQVRLNEDGDVPNTMLSTGADAVADGIEMSTSRSRRSRIAFASHWVMR